MTDGKTFAIIVKVVERKFEKQKHALLDQSVLSKISNHFSKKNFIIYNCIIDRKNTHTGFFTLGKTNE